MEIKIKYFSDDIERLRYIDGKSDWIDLRAAADVELKQGEFKLIPLGVAMELPKGYEAHVVPRSSTFKNFGILQTNSMGVIDESYCGDGDQWFMPAYAVPIRSSTKTTASASSASWSTSPRSPSLSLTRWATPIVAVTEAPARPKPSVTLCAARAYTAV